MNRVLQLQKKLLEEPVVDPVLGFRLRTYVDQADLRGWLDLRQATFAREKLGVRAWDAADFHQEFVSKPWWKAEHCWIMEESNHLECQDSIKQIVGSITLAMRGQPEAAKPVVHWLMVHPRFRHAGIGRWLLNTLELQAWQLGYREVFLETHSAWEAAGRFYAAAGYTTKSQ